MDIIYDINDENLHNFGYICVIKTDGHENNAAHSRQDRQGLGKTGT